jgi:hypothetical protein
MAETLLTPSSIKLFGRVVNSLTYKDDTSPFGYNNFLQKQLAAGPPISTAGSILNDVVPKSGDANQNDPYLVTGVASTTGLVPGMTITGWTQPIVGPPPIPSLPAFAQGTSIVPPITNDSFKISMLPLLIANNVKLTATLFPAFARIYAFSFEGAYYPLSRPSMFLIHGSGQPVGNWDVPSTMDQGGVAGREWDFSGNKYARDLAYWEYEKGDFSLRLDMEAGPFEQILLQMALRSGADRADRSGAGVSGAGVSGAGVSGAGVSGAGVSGAGVSGAGLRR